MARTQLTLLAIIALASITLYTLKNQTQHNQDFEVWKNKHGKQYSSTEEIYRLGVYLQNSAFVDSHNQRYEAGLETYQVGLNQFADLPSEEYRAQYLNKLDKPSITKKCSGAQAPTSNLPDSFDWIVKGGVTTVKNQGSCGSCWAFSAIGSLEGVYYNNKGKLLQFSQQQLVDCSTKKDYGNEGCNGGDMPNAFWYIIDNGITTSDKYPYTGKTQKCYYTDAMKVYQIKDCTEVTANKELNLKASIVQNPVAVSVDAGGSGFQFYTKGIFSGKCGTSLNHGVLATGYGSESGKGYWVIKNSWGASWGTKGYIWLAQNGDGKGQCGINMENSFPIQ